MTQRISKIPNGVYRCRVSLTDTFLAMRTGEVAAFEMDAQRYQAARAAAVSLHRKGRGMWTTSTKIMPGKVVITRIK